jgi:hypothetical protein
MATESKSNGTVTSASKKSPARPTAARRGKARRGRAGTKSTAIRTYIEKHPDAGPTAVSTALKKKGIDASPTLVSNVKARMNLGAGRPAANGKPRRKPGRPGRRPAAGDSVSIAKLIEARKFAASVGGVDEAVSLLQSLARLQ